MDNEIRKNFSVNLRKYMELRGKKQADLCQYIGVSSATVSDWYNGVKIPRIDKVVSIANWLGTDLNELITGASTKSTVFDAAISGLTAEGQARVLEYARLLSLDPEYKRGE